MKDFVQHYNLNNTAAYSIEVEGKKARVVRFSNGKVLKTPALHPRQIWQVIQGMPLASARNQAAEAFKARYGTNFSV